MWDVEQRKRTASLRRRFSARLITRPQYFHMSTIDTASTTPPAAPPAIAPTGTDEPPPEDVGRPVELEPPVEYTVSVTTCTPLAGEGGLVGCCGAMSLYTPFTATRIMEEDGYNGTEEKGEGGRQTESRGL